MPGLWTIPPLHFAVCSNAAGVTARILGGSLAHPAVGHYMITLQDDIANGEYIGLFTLREDAALTGVAAITLEDVSNSQKQIHIWEKRNVGKDHVDVAFDGVILRVGVGSSG